MITIVKKMLSAGISVIPTNANKTPACKWKEFQSRFVTEEEAETLFANVAGVAMIGGKISGGLECLDFDMKGLLFDAWFKALERVDSFLFYKLVISKTQSGGRHVIYRCDAIEGSQKIIMVESNGSGTTVVPHCAIETRGEGGYFLVEPSPKYEWIKGNPSEIKNITPHEREVLFECCYSKEVYEELTRQGLQQYIDKPVPKSSPNTPPLVYQNDKSPLEMVLELNWHKKALEEAGWSYVGMDDDKIHELWKHPTATHRHSASLNKDNGYFRCWSPNGLPFTGGKNYKSGEVYAMLKFNGDNSAAAKYIFSQGYGSYENISKKVSKDPNVFEDYKAEEFEIKDGQPANTYQYLPDDLLDVPGFVNDFKDFTARFSKWNQPEIALASGLVFMSFLIGRRVKDEWDNRPVLFMDVVSESGTGKGCIDSAISTVVNQYHGIIPHRCFIDNKINKLSSRAALDKVLGVRKKLLIIWDEYGDSLKVAIRSQQSFQYGLISTWTELFSQANKIYTPTTTTMIGKGSKSQISTIIQPHITFCGLTNPEDYRAAIVGNLLSSGYIPRRFVMWGRSDSSYKGIEKNITVPSGILDSIYMWDFIFAPVDEPMEGVKKIKEGDEEKMSLFNPQPFEIKTSSEAAELWIKYDLLIAKFLYNKNYSESVKSSMNRIVEKAHSMALIRTCSRIDKKSELTDDELKKEVEKAMIEIEDVRWAFLFTLINAVMFARWSQDTIIDSSVENRNATLTVKMSNWFKLNVNKMISKTQVALKFKHNSTKERLEAINNLKEQKLIDDKIEGSTIYYVYTGIEKADAFDKLIKEAREII